jgi:hypothetical protein
MFARHLPYAFLFALLSLPACAQSASDEASTSSELTENPTPVPGAQINSPSVNPEKMYWGARTIQILVDVGYLTADEAAVAKRADGIIASGTANGAIGVQELAMLESPAHIGTLFPQERAVIPKLWKILEIDDAANITPPGPQIPTTIHDTISVTPFALAITSLPASSQSLAKRIQLTHDSDHDATTISGLDMEGAFADRSSYLPEELASFRGLHNAIQSAAPHFPLDARYVETPAQTDTSLYDANGVTAFSRILPGPDGSWTRPNDALPTLTALTDIQITNHDPATTKLVILNRTTGADALVSAPTSSILGMRAEVWKNGARLAALDNSPVPPVHASIPFGYTVKVGANEWALSCSAQSACSYMPPAQGQRIASPGSFRVAGNDDWRVDIFPNGVGSVIHGDQTYVCYPTMDDFGRLTGCLAATADVMFSVVYNWFDGGEEPYAMAVVFNRPNLGVQGLYAY